MKYIIRVPIWLYIIILLLYVLHDGVFLQIRNNRKSYKNSLCAQAVNYTY